MHPMLLIPAYKDNLWGGSRLKTEYGKQTETTPLAESWELSCHKDGASALRGEEAATLPEYIARHPEAVGIRGARFAYFPVLFKLIDAKQNLSVQVHPDDSYALRAEGEYGKTEQWIILECEPGAKLVFGFRRDISKAELRAKIADDSFMEAVNFVPVQRGDVFFIPAGTLHAIGAGIVIAEIQQNSNSTYRVYDYGRLGADGKPRALHVEKALDVTDTAAYKAPPVNFPERQQGGCRIETLADCDYFKTERLTLAGTCPLLVDEGSFLGLFCAEGEVNLESAGGVLRLIKGQTAFLPAGLGGCTLTGTAQLISMGV